MWNGFHAHKRDRVAEKENYVGPRRPEDLQMTNIYLIKKRHIQNMLNSARNQSIQTYL